MMRWLWDVVVARSVPELHDALKDGWEPYAGEFSAWWLRKKIVTTQAPGPIEASERGYGQTR